MFYIYCERKVFIRFGKRGNKAPKKYHILIGKVVKAGKYGDNYKIRCRDPFSKQVISSWFSVENIADCRVKHEKQAKKWSEKTTRYQGLVMNPHDQIEKQGFFIS